MKLKKIILLSLLSLFIAGCEAGFDEIINDANKADAALYSVTIKNSSTSAGIGFNFSRGVTSYKVYVGTDTDSVDITAVPVKSGATMQYRIDGVTWSDMSGAQTVSGLLAAVDKTKTFEIQVTSSGSDVIVVYSFRVAANPVYRVTYNIGTGNTSGTVPVDSSEYGSGTTVTVSGNTGNLVGPEVGGEHAGKGIMQALLGWSTDSSATTAEFTAGSTFTITADTALYAIYTSDTSVIRKVGPAGGYVFYDNGSYTGTPSWRYLEAAPEDVSETKYVWSTLDNTQAGTSTGIGAGYANTYTYTNSSYYPASEACRGYSYGGYSSGWFLPSQYELYEIYNVLYAHGIGNFVSNGTYWSSSEHGYDYGTPSWFWANLMSFPGVFSSVADKQNLYFVRAVRGF